MFTYTRWADMMGDQVSKIIEAETGQITLLHVDDCDLETLMQWWRDGVKPKEAAILYIAGQGRTINALLPGAMYWFKYKLQAGNYQWYEHETIAMFLNYADKGKQIVVSGRPEFGTAQLEKENVLQFKIMEDGTHPRQPRRVKSSKA
jgi:uncharacterized protein YprB with RNaseH-like and TPR domain